MIRGGVLLCLLASLLVAPGLADAGGGASIGSAPKIVSGVEELGNTAVNSNEFWLLRLRVGDKVRVVWGSTSKTVSDLAVYPPGTNDKNHDHVTPLLHDINWHMVAKLPTNFEPTKPGLYALQFWCGSPLCTKAGPYVFTVSANHKALLYLPTLAEIRASGKLKGFVRTPDGRPITDPALSLRLFGTWKDASYVPASRHLLAKASPVAGVVVFSFEIPPKLLGRSIVLQVLGGGEDYQSVSSPEQKVRVRA